jgi:putative transposase
MALDESAMTELLAALRAGGGLDVVRQALALVLRALIDAEATEVIGADRYQRSQQRTTHRNGSRSRLLSTKAGDVDLKIPKLRGGSFFPALLEPRRRIDRALLAVVIEAYVHGTSTRKVDDLVKALGVDAGISESEVSRICAELDAEVARFRSRSLGHIAFPYLFLDATCLKARVDGRVVSRAVVIATGVTADGGREILGLDVGDSEDGAFWTAFLRSLKARGLAGVQLVISDAHTGLKQAIGAVLAGAGWQRCRVHFDAGSTSSETCLPGCPRPRPRWSPPPSAPSSPSPPAPRSPSSWTRSWPCFSPSSPRSPPCWLMPART